MRAELCAPTAATSPVQRIAVIVNKQAGGIRRRPEVVGALTRAVEGRGEVITTSSPDELVRALGRARMRGVDTVGICGGDGTNLHTLTAIARVYKGAAWPRITLLAGGTVNTAAGNLGCRGPVERTLQRLLDSSAPLVRRRPLLRVNDRIGFIFGSQAVARILDEYYAGRTGPVGCATLATRIVWSAATGGPLTEGFFRPEEVEFELDGRRLGKRNATCVLASVVASPAVGLRATHRGGEDGCFHLVVADTSPRQLFREAGRAWVGLPVEQIAIDELARHVSISYPGEAPYTLDGDVFRAEKLELTATAPVDLLAPGID